MGSDPLTGDFGTQVACADADVIRALHVGVSVPDQRTTAKERTSTLPGNAGKPWSTGDELMDLAEAHWRKSLL